MTAADGTDVWQWLGGADNLTATLLAMAAISLGMRAIVRRTLLKRRVFRRSLDSLAIGVNHEYVSSVFGAHAFGRLDDQGFGALTWVSVHGYVYVSFAHGSAEQFAITVTDPWLHYDPSKLTLGVLKGRLAQAVTGSGGITARYVSVGARRLWCVVTHYAGNPGGYLHFSLSYNDASGLGVFPQCVIDSGTYGYADGALYADGSLPGLSLDMAAQIDRQLIPNTLIVTRNSELLEKQVFGVDQDVVRLLPRRQTWAERMHLWRLRRKLARPR